MNQTKRKGWTSIRSVLGGSLTRPDSEDPQSLAWYDFQWKLIVGEDLTAVTQVNKLSAKSLFVTVSDKKWFPALKSFRKKIIAEINQSAGSVLISRIVFQEGTIVNPVTDDTQVARKQYSLEQKKIEGTEVMAKDESLRNILDRISSKLQIAPLALMLLFVSNCTTLPVEQSSGNIDLSGSYAVRVAEKMSAEQTGVAVRDPRSYYHYFMALNEIRHHQFGKAADNFRKLVEFDKGDSQFYRQLAMNLLRAGKVDDAYKVLEESLHHFPANPELNMMIGDILDGREEYERALTHYQRVIQTEPGSARAHLLRGTVYERLKQFDLAADMYQQVIRVEPRNPLGYHYLARMDILSGKLKDAKSHLSQTLELRPNLLQSREFLAWVWEKLGNAEEAAREYKILLKLDPLNKKIHERITGMKDSMTPVDVDTSQYRLAAEDLLGEPKVHMRIGAVYYEQALYLKALDEFQLIRARKQTKEVLMVLGRVYEILGRVDKAIEEMKVLLEMEPKSVNLMVYSARFYSMNEQPEETIRLLESAVKIDPENDTLHHSLALAYMSVDKLDQAISKIQKAISLNEGKDSYYFELGALLERTGQFELAIQNMKRSIELNPMHSNAHNFLGYMYAIQGKSLDKAIGHLNKALSIQPRNGYFLDSLSWIYFKKGESQRALDELKKAMVYTSPDPVLYSHLGDIHFSLKNYIEAGKAWKTSLFLTMEKMDDTDGELPDPKDLEKKIRGAREFLNKN